MQPGCTTVGGNITTVAGGGTGCSSFGGDGGPANNACLNYPNGVATDSAGNLFIADSSNDRIREVVTSTISTVAGNGSTFDATPANNIPALGVTLYNADGVVADAAQNIFISDQNNDYARELLSSQAMSISSLEMELSAMAAITGQRPARNSTIQPEFRATAPAIFLSLTSTTTSSERSISPAAISLRWQERRRVLVTPGTARRPRVHCCLPPTMCSSIATATCS